MAIKTKVLKNGQYLGDGHILRNEGDDWFADVDTDDDSANSFSGS